MGVVLWEGKWVWCCGRVRGGGEQSLVGWNNVGKGTDLGVHSRKACSSELTAPLDKSGNYFIISSLTPCPFNKPF